jgi:hypothetical protein
MARAYGSERILEYLVNAINRFGDKLKNGHYPLRNHYSSIPAFHHSM